MLQRLIEKTQTMTGVTGDTYTEAIDLDMCATLAVQSVIDVNTPSAKTFPSSDVNTTTDAITEVAHGFFTGLKGQFTTTGVLPTGIAAVTDYFLIVLTADTFQVATSLANALAGTEIDITAQGSGNDTFTPTSLAAATISYQRTNITNAAGDGASTTAANWSDIDTATAVTVDATTWYSVVGPTHRWFRIKGTVTAGSMTITNYILSRGDSKS